MNMYVLLIITLNSWHLCFNRGILHRKFPGYVLLPILYYQVSIQSSCSILASTFLSSIFAKRFSHRGRYVADVRVAVFGSYGGQCRKSVHALYRDVFGFLRGVRSSVCQYFVAGVPAAFPSRSFPHGSILSLCAAACGRCIIRPVCCLSVCHNTLS